jgi:uncharacterized protein
MVTVYVDADACPVTRDTISLARSHRVPIVLVGNETQNLARFDGKPGVEVLQVLSGPDAADFAIVAKLTPQDIVVTSDIGLAAMTLGKGARAVSFRGHVYSPMSIDMELAVRHAEQRHRRAGGRTQGPPIFREEDRERFRDSFVHLLAARPV